MWLLTGVYGDRKRVCTESWLAGNLLPHWGFEPASVVCQSHALPNLLHFQLSHWETPFNCHSGKPHFVILGNTFTYNTMRNSFIHHRGLPHFVKLGTTFTYYNEKLVHSSSLGNPFICHTRKPLHFSYWEMRSLTQPHTSVITYAIKPEMIVSLVKQREKEFHGCPGRIDTTP